jgi:hypothetical protein
MAKSQSSDPQCHVSNELRLGLSEDAVAVRDAFFFTNLGKSLTRGYQGQVGQAIRSCVVLRVGKKVRYHTGGYNHLMFCFGLGKPEH